jgi:hypothetical protein
LDEQPDTDITAIITTNNIVKSLLFFILNPPRD